MHFADALTERIARTSPVCVGLDPQLGKLPADLPKDCDGVKVFCMGIIDAVSDVASCVKPQLAYFEILGWEGMKVFWEVCAYAKGKDLVVIADGKRNDIGSTCEAYADAYLYEGSPVDALTVSPYLGSDGITPFIQRCTENEKGIYIIVKTSNKSSGELQDLPVGDEVVHEHLAQLVESWGMHHIGPKTNLSCVGAVVGATYPEELKYLRTLMPHIPFLIPGYGAQGGTAEDTKWGFLPDGTGAIVNASRSIIYASEGKDWKEAAGKAAEGMAKELTKILEND
ncbi:MAG: orotidine-5'-phosphate decarboxylase [Candidatus Peregrinibacteria bacterium]|nr:orotidine-5'-phosphate decarboxylase [Candidatus Peregrinibacteria bacterium]